MNTNVTPHEYHLFLDHMFYMYTKIAQYLRLIFEVKPEMTNELFNSENLIQLISLLAYSPQNNRDRSENFWQTKINLAHLITHVLLQQSSTPHQLINHAIVQHAPALFSNVLPSAPSASMVIRLLSLSQVCSLFHFKR